MIIKRVYDLARPRLSGKKIKEVRIGLELMAVELDDGSIGVTYVLRKETVKACSALPQAGKLIGTSAEKAAGWAVHGGNIITSAIGLAVMNSVAAFDELIKAEDASDADAVFSVDIQHNDTVGIVGKIGPVINRLKGKGNRLHIFERGGDIPEHVLPESDQPKFLPECQVVFITSSTLINGTLDHLLKHCANAREVVMVGSSTPLYPEAFSNSGVTVLSGTEWPSENREEILTNISQCAGMRQLIKYGKKISVKVP